MSEQELKAYLRKDEPQGSARRLMLLVNPFTRLAGWQALGWGLLVVAATAALAAVGNVAYDGVADLHIPFHPLPAWFLACMAVADWLVVAVVFLVAGKLFSRSRQRVVDYFGATALGRFPYLLAGVLFSPPLLGRIVTQMNTVMGGNPEQMMQRLLQLPGFAWLVVGGIVVCALGAWLGVLNFFALKECSGMKVGRALAVFFPTALVAEVLTKVLFGYVVVAAGLMSPV